MLSGLLRRAVTILPVTLIGNYFQFPLLISQWRSQQNWDSIHFLQWMDQWFFFFLLFSAVLMLYCHYANCAMWGKTNEIFLRLDQVTHVNLFHKIFWKRSCTGFVDLFFEVLSFPEQFRRPTASCTLSFCWGTDMNQLHSETCTGDRSCGFMNVLSWSPASSSQGGELISSPWPNATK